MTTVVNIHAGEEYDVCIMRPSKWGNPYSHKSGTAALFRVQTREQAIEKFRAYLRGRPDLVEAARAELRGKRLGCCCKPADCHGDVLAEVADGMEP